MPPPLNCPEIDYWKALFSDTVPADQREVYERHLESCAACQDRLDHDEEEDPLRRLGRQFGDPATEPTDPVLTQVLERLSDVPCPDARPSTQPTDLYFLRPSEQPEILGTLGDYEVYEVIGEGGMGIVLKAADPALHRLVAIKVIAAALAGSAVARQRFKREAQAAAAVCHDNIVTVHGVHEADGLPYLVMQYIPGESLQARLDRTGHFEVLDIVQIGLQTASGLAAAHAQGLIHRDIKPANLLLEDGLSRVKITDFGLARMADAAPLTQNGVLAGTPEYMAPEQARGETIDHRADLFSLGSVLYALCTGVPPFRGSTTVAVLRQVSDLVPTAIRTLNPDVPAWLEALVAHLMAKDPADRFQSAAEVAALLEGYLAHLRQPVTIAAPELPLLPTAACPGPTRHSLQTEGRQQFPSVLWLSGIAVLVLLGLGMAFWLAGGNGGTDSGSAKESEFSQRFEGSNQPSPGLKLFGVQAEKYARFEPGGLEIALPAGYPGQRPHTGVATGFGLKGDFEITVDFEILLEDRDFENPEKITGLSLEVIPQRSAEVDPEQWLKPSQNKASLVRNLGPRQRTVFQTNLTQWDGAAARDDVIRHTFPTTTKGGRLRLARTGAILSYLVSEGSVDEFTLLHKEPFGTRDLQRVRIVATTSSLSAALTVRLKELRIRAQSFTRTPAAAVVRKTSWWRPLLIVGSVILVLNLGVWFAVRRRSGKNPEPAPVQDQQATPEEAAFAIRFPCSACGKNLRVKTELAGKKVKCRKCNQVVQVPQTSPSDRVQEQGTSLS